MEVFVAILDKEGTSEVYGVFKKYEDAMEICKKEALIYSDELYPKQYKYGKISYHENTIFVDTFVWKVLTMNIK